MSVKVGAPLVGVLLAGIAASLCCIDPLVVAPSGAVFVCGEGLLLADTVEKL